MSTSTGPRPSITVETGHGGLTDAAALPFSPLRTRPAKDAAPAAAIYPAGRGSVMGAGGALAAYTGTAEVPSDFGTFDGGGDGD